MIDPLGSREEVIIRESLNEPKINCILYRYIPNASNAIFDVLKDMANQHASKKKRFEGEDADLLKQVSVNSVTREILKDKLAQHVEKVSLDVHTMSYVV